MRTIWHSLAWKEWHEHKWKLAALALIGISASTITLFTIQEALFMVPYLLSPFFIPFTIFVAAGTATGERARRTLPFLQALPVSPSRVARHKLAFGAATCIIPVLIGIMAAAAIYWAYHSLGIEDRVAVGAPTSGESWSAIVGQWLSIGAPGTALIVASLFLWVAAIGVNNRDEISASARAILVIVIASAAIGVGLSVVENSWPKLAAPGIYVVSGVVIPGGLLPLLSISPRGPEEWRAAAHLGMALSAVVHVMLFVWFARRFGRTVDLGDRSPPSATVDDPTRPLRLAPPRRTRLRAIAWKQTRESGSLLLVGLAAITGLVVLNVVTDFERYSDEPLRVAQLAGQVTVTLGIILALVVGIGVFLFDLEPRLNNFWRSRPIHPAQWYWAKLLTGLIVLFAALYLPLFMVAWVMWPSGLPSMGYLPDDTWATVLVQTAVYTSAVALACLVRHAIYAAVLGVATVFGAIGITWLVWLGAAYYGLATGPTAGPLDSFSTSSVATIMGATAVLLALVGWLAVRYDWGYKSRY